MAGSYLIISCLHLFIFIPMLCFVCLCEAYLCLQVSDCVCRWLWEGKKVIWCLLEQCLCAHGQMDVCLCVGSEHSWKDDCERKPNLLSSYYLLQAKSSLFFSKRWNTLGSSDHVTTCEYYCLSKWTLLLSLEIFTSKNINQVCSGMISLHNVNTQQRLLHLQHLPGATHSNTNTTSRKPALRHA